MPTMEDTPVTKIAPVGELIERMDARVPALLERYAVPGVAVAVVDDGEVVWAQGYGLAGKASGAPVTPDTVFQVASISKAVTAWGVMRLIERGDVDLDAPVETYLTRWHIPDSEFDSDGVTVRRLLSHTAGLSLSGYVGFEPEQPLPDLVASLNGDTGGVGDVHLIMEPGTAYEYSGGGYTVLQLLIEEVTGETFVDYMQREVLDALGMGSSSFEWTDDLRPLTATAYNDQGEPLPNFLFAAKAAAGLYTTAPALGQFVAAAMDGPAGEPPGRGLLTADTVRLMHTPLEGNVYSLGHSALVVGDTLRMGHSGVNLGWRSFFVAVPDERIGIVLLSNSDNAEPIGSATNFRSDVFCIWATWTGNDAFPECPKEPA